MAVHHARRGVTVAWVSAVVNMLVVIVALGTPLFQRQIDRMNEQEAAYARKSSLISEARKIYFDGIESKDSLSVIIDPDFDLGKNMDVKTRTEIIEEIDHSLSNLLDENKFLFNEPTDDINYRNIVAVLESRIKHLRLAARRTKYVNENRKASGAEALRKSSGQFQQQYIRDLEQIKLLIYLNYDSYRHDAKLGPIVFGDCDNANYTKFCEDPSLLS